MEQPRQNDSRQPDWRSLEIDRALRSESERSIRELFESGAFADLMPVEEPAQNPLEY